MSCIYFLPLYFSDLWNLCIMYFSSCRCFVTPWGSTDDLCIYVFCDIVLWDNLNLIMIQIFLRIFHMLQYHFPYIIFPIWASKLRFGEIIDSSILICLYSGLLTGWSFLCLMPWLLIVWFSMSLVNVFLQFGKEMRTQMQQTHGSHDLLNKSWMIHKNQSVGGTLLNNK